VGSNPTLSALLMKLSRFSSPFALRTGRNSKQNAGRGNSGRISVRHRGGGHKRLHRSVTWSASFSGRVVGFFYDSRRSARVAQILSSAPSTASSSYAFRLAAKGRTLFQDLTSAPSETLRPGDVALLSRFEPGDFVHAVVDSSSSKATLARAAGSFCQVRSVGSSFSSAGSSASAVLRLPSGSHRLVPFSASATTGRVAASEDFYASFQKRGSNRKKPNGLGKAGRSRWLGRRPTVRGVARNPVDHPHGGTSRGRPSVTFKG
jgi:large subunit ribosomal protein L2